MSVRWYGANSKEKFERYLTYHAARGYKSKMRKSPEYDDKMSRWGTFAKSSKMEYEKDSIGPEGYYTRVAENSICKVKTMDVSGEFEHIFKELSSNPNMMGAKFSKDLAKVGVNFTDFIFEGDDNQFPMIGWNSIQLPPIVSSGSPYSLGEKEEYDRKTKLSFWGCYSNPKYGVPVFFLMYLDDNAHDLPVRAFVPVKGNNINPNWKSQTEVFDINFDLIKDEISKRFLTYR